MRRSSRPDRYGRHVPGRCLRGWAIGRGGSGLGGSDAPSRHPVTLDADDPGHRFFPFLPHILPVRSAYGMTSTRWAGRRIPAFYFRMLIARAITSAPMTRDTIASIIMSSLAHRLTAEISVGLNAVAVKKPSDR